MKLATRISLFFLAALAIVLVGFSGSIYWLVHSHLFHQLDTRSAAALETLNAAIESGPSGLEWEVNDPHLFIDPAGLNEPLVWGVFDNNGQRVDGSKQSMAVLNEENRFNEGDARSKEDVIWQGETWRIVRLKVRAEISDKRIPTNGVRPGEEPAAKRYPALVMAVATSLSHVTSQLRALGLALVGLTVFIWLSAAFLGRSLCRNALAPLTRMADSIATISAEDLGQRLFTSTTGDEVEDLSRAFNDLLTRLQVSFERQRRFAGEASHQLRTPLTAMLGQVDVALRRERTSHEYHKTLESVHEQAIRLRQIVEMLLFLTREEAESSPPEFERIELNNWLAGHLAAWQRHPRHAELCVETDPTLPLWISAHGGLLGQVVDNLLDNACKYSEPSPAITVRTTQTEKDVCLVIEDCGYGISENELTRVFDPFFRSVDARQRGVAGIGLGLSIVQRIVSALGAKLTVVSTIRQGSQFTIRFRAATETQLPYAESSAPASSEVKGRNQLLTRDGADGERASAIAPGATSS